MKKIGTATVIASHGLPVAARKPRKDRATTKPNKYRNQPTMVDGIKFQSKREARRYGELKLLQRANKIEHLTLQRSFALEVNGQLVTTYIADFDYFEVDTGQWVVEDVKGLRTPVYQLKKALMRACRGIEIREV